VGGPSRQKCKKDLFAAPGNQNGGGLAAVASSAAGCVDGNNLVWRIMVKKYHLHRSWR